jgi:hypothetical protein
MTVFSYVCIAVSVAISVAAALSAARLAALVRDLQDQLAPLPISRLDSLERSIGELGSALQEVANRVKMQKVRNAANHVRENGVPDPYAQPDEWRRYMNKQLRSK